MVSQAPPNDPCLECRWEGFHIDPKTEKAPSLHPPEAQWSCSDVEHHASLAECGTDEVCCEADNCTDDCDRDCDSVCDGYVDCGASTTCSVADCDETHCENAEPVCFDNHCCEDEVDPNCTFESILGIPPSMFDPTHFLPTATTMHCNAGELGKPVAETLPINIDQCSQFEFLSSYQAHATQCEQHVQNHLGCQDFQKDWQGMFNHQTQPLPQQLHIDPTDLYQILGGSHDFGVCHSSHLDITHHEHPIPDTFGHFNHEPLACPGHEHHHLSAEFKNPNHFDLHVHGPHRTQHRCRSHHHHQAHPYSPYSRHSRSGVSSHFMSSPRDTPPPLEKDRSSVLTTPEESAEDKTIHQCKWMTSINGVEVPCGAVFADSGALQDHLVAEHTNTIAGARGKGYYCRWQGCYRPDEAFSQKSKLQGHFLTHSNHKSFKCSVCGKTFARQATLDRHERSHRGDKPYRCKTCGKTFTDSSELSKSFLQVHMWPMSLLLMIVETHSRIHTGEKPFKCTFPGCNFETGDVSEFAVIFFRVLSRD
ncbi:hypothetical protein N7539_004239 [Penicillium diatomitis]|uniref:C2H2-type domain-containing protein n=1 Tax=Penicillium diatomitis TaxID=2819901 RepID=A0A9W9XDM0_9EURO|nr:uncharacterized protein N7539_004239 [Penicillium diatomitis]KAJ5489349.1 hypothetical protein N7539_004239 [Penicillium diatomitis]